jgi:hypothetical protein
MRYIERSLVHGSVCMLMISRIEMALAAALLLMVGTGVALAQHCTLSGTDVSCDDGRTGQFAGDAIIWPDGTRSSPVQHPSVIIGNRPSVQVGPGVFVGKGDGMVPLDNPNGRFKKQCAELSGVSYCY